MNITQIFIFILGATSIWLVSRKEDWKRWGYIFGLCSQPFWLYETFTNEQWGIFALSVFYTYSWIQGIFNYWINIDDEKNIWAPQKDVVYILTPDCKWERHIGKDHSILLKSKESIEEMFENTCEGYWDSNDVFKEEKGIRTWMSGKKPL